MPSALEVHWSRVVFTKRLGREDLCSLINFQAGGLYEKLGQFDRALDAYQKGDVYRNAVDLCRSHFPQQVVSTEEVSW